MNKIIEILQLDESDYEDLITDTYIRWCLDFCRNYGSDFQVLLANASLNKYFWYEYAKLEREFLQLSSRYKENAKSEDLRVLYADCTLQIFNRRSKVLIESAKTLKIENYVN